MRIDDLGLHLRQSDIATYISCPEQYRRTYWDDAVGSGESDAALVGTSLHALIETECSPAGFFGKLGEARDWAVTYFTTAIAEFDADPMITYSRSSFRTDEKAIAHLQKLVGDWWSSEERKFLKGQDPAERINEWNFDVPFITVGDTNVWLCGTSDLVLPKLNQVWDWKTSGKPYELWEKQRWAIQPTVYLYAAQQEGWIGHDENGAYQFSYKVFIRGGDRRDPITYDVFRTAGSFGWLETVVTNMVTMQQKVGTDTPWPVNDHGWHCSPKWCPFWDTCKGKHVDADNGWR